MLLPVLWKNNKTGNHYVVLAEEVTHSETNELMVFYQAVLTGRKFVRPQKLFLEKFTPVTFDA